MRELIVSLLCASAAATMLGQTPTTIQTGPAVGATVPAFSAVDQSGAVTTLPSILGPKGALLVFFRSADW